MKTVKLEETDNRRRLHIGSYFVDLNESDFQELVKIFSRPTHSEETETTPTPWEQSGNGIFQKNGTSCIATTHNINGNEHEREANTQLIVTAVNSHSSLVRRVEELETENEQLEKEITQLQSENKEQLSELLQTVEKLDACENVLADAQIDNEAKEKRIQELEALAKKFMGCYIVKYPTAVMPNDEAIYTAYHNLKSTLSQ